MLIWFERVPLGGDLAKMIALVILVGFAIGAVTCAIALPLLRRLRLRQHAYEDAPQSHQVKTGTPTMGGICFVTPLLVLLASPKAPFVMQFFFVVTACAAIGFADDLLGILRGKNQGLRARTKYLLTALVAVIFLNALNASYGMFPRDVILRAGTFSLGVPHWLWLVLGILAVTGTVHAVNLTDGLDGLATGTMIPPLMTFAVLGFWFVIPAAAEVALLGIGACLAFLLFYNRYPAKMFMGDTGSLALGAMLASLAIVTGEMLLLVVIGGVFVAEALSVILQVAYFKRTGGKRIFRMSPLHHHFELEGWPETKVTSGFWIASLLCSAIGMAIAL
ncbi:MAG TPA: phospho-N-acetylmuramoyl-pentapeptide-transferase [Candidatus Baltobacteraceae bacterium]|nr:phospho-N-acetylmuramoyl-pentapeptide-transferase [Candidatus Baltobacteraceae bacterium]